MNKLVIVSYKCNFIVVMDEALTERDVEEHSRMLAEFAVQEDQDLNIEEISVTPIESLVDLPSTFYSWEHPLSLQVDEDGNGTVEECGNTVQRVFNELTIEKAEREANNKKKPCKNKVVTIDGKKYKLVEIKE